MNSERLELTKSQEIQIKASLHSTLLDWAERRKLVTKNDRVGGNIQANSGRREQRFSCVSANQIVNI